MKISKRILIIMLVSIPCVGCDQMTKILATEYLPKDAMDTYFYDLLRLGYTENIGAFLGLGSAMTNEVRFGVFVVAVGLILIGLFFFLVLSTKCNIYSFVALCFVFSGGLSNFYDRALNNGAVVDFLNIGIGSFRTGVFNLADVAILLGTLVFVFVEQKQKTV